MCGTLISLLPINFISDGYNLRRLQSSDLFVLGITFVACIVTRLISTVYYIEDIDSLRFALSIIDYDVAKLQPHFPAYPVFCLVAKLLYFVIRRYALAFSLIGGLSTFLIIFFTLKIARIAVNTILGKLTIIVIFLTPLLWLMGNRYMPDAMGIACLLASLYLVTAQVENQKNTLFCSCTIGFLLAGILLGIRISYLPMLIPAILITTIRNHKRIKFIIAGVVGILIWLIPLILITGWGTLINAAQTQSLGHFTEFGGTVSTDSYMGLRLSTIFESLFADGFGLYWNGRHLLTLCTTILIICIVIISFWKTVRQRLVEQQSMEKSIFLNPIFLGCVLYLIWIFLAQNVVYKSRHVLPLLPFITLGVAYACNRIITVQGVEMFRNRWMRRIRLLFVWGIVSLFLLCYCSATIITVVQHTRPTAIAQMHRYLQNKQIEQDNKLYIVSVPLITYYLSSQGFDSNYISVKSDEDLVQLNEIDTGIIAIGSSLPNREPKDVKTFYHNPYVNRMWSELSLFEY